MDKKQQEYIRKQAEVKTAPAPGVKRKEMTPEEAEKARQARRASNRKAAGAEPETETSKPGQASKAGGKTKE